MNQSALPVSSTSIAVAVQPQLPLTPKEPTAPPQAALYDQMPPQASASIGQPVSGTTSYSIPTLYSQTLPSASTDQPASSVPTLSALSYPLHRLPSTPNPFQDVGLARPHTTLIDKLDLPDLMGNPHVRDLLMRANGASQQLSQQADNYSQLLQHLHLVQTEVHDLRQQLLVLQNQPTPSSHQGAPTIAPFANPSAAAPAPTFDVIRPANRPAHYPESILWTFGDCKKHGLVTGSNKSRPKLYLCIRDQEGNPITQDAFDSITDSAKMHIHNILFPLPTPPNPAAKTMTKSKKYYRKYHPVEYRKVIEELEGFEPLLRLCAPSWKADHIVRQSLQALIDAGRPKKSKKRKRSPQEDVSEAEADFAPEGDDGAAARDEQDTDDEDGSNSEGNGADSELSTSPSLIASSTSTSTSPPLSSQLSTLGTAALPQADTLPQVPNRSSPTDEHVNDTNSNAPKSTNAPARHVDIDYIVVDTSVSSIRMELAAFPEIDCASDLLNSMEKSPSHFCGQPSQDLLMLIAAIDSADPNARDLSEDETNAGWGHRQLSGSWRAVVTNWDKVGNCQTACRLIAAVVRTCKVARQLCFERKIQVSGYISDAYLDQIITKLWDCWKEADGPIVKQKEVDRSALGTDAPTGGASATLSNSGRVDDSSIQGSATETVAPTPLGKPAIEKLLSGLLIEDLKVWMQKFKVAAVAGKKSKDGYKTAILDSPLSVSESGYTELQSLSRARKALKKQKKASE